MLESELFALLENTAEAVYVVTEGGEIRSWNRSAERLFGYPADEVLHRNIDEVVEARDTLGTQPLAGGFDATTRTWQEHAEGIPAFDLDVRTRSGERIWISVSTILFENQRTGHRLFVRLAHDITPRRHREELNDRMLGVARELVALAEDNSGLPPVEPLSDQERRVLRHFADGGNPVAIARALGISPQTLRNHLHHINRKLRTHNRLEAVTHAQRHGLLD
jgi:PAS domain S-box-containing protein